MAYQPLGRLDWSKLEVNLVEDKLITDLASKYNRTPVQIILNWNMCRDVIVIPKASSKPHQEENFNARDFQMDQAEVDSITKKFDKGIIVCKVPSMIGGNVNMFC